MLRSVQVLAGMLILALFSGLTTAMPLASAQSAVVVSMPNGAGSPNGAPGYAPATIVVVIGVNNTVTWTNNDTAHHTVTPGNEPAGATWSVGSGDMAPKGVYSFTFTVPGNYTYTCAYHNWMAGAVVVKGVATTTVKSSSTSSSTTTSSTNFPTTSTSSSTTTSTTPEFPVGYLAVILFAVIAAVMVAAPRLRPGRPGPPSI